MKNLRLLTLVLVPVALMTLCYPQTTSVLKITDPSTLAATDSVDWSLAGSNGTDVLSGFVVTSPGGITVTTTFAEPFEEILIPWLFTGSFFWNGGPLNESGLGANRGGPTTFSFSRPVSGAGLFVQVSHIDSPGPFTASLSAYNGITLLGTFTEDGNSFGQQIFLGVSSTSANITSVVINTTTGSYGMGTLRLRNGCQVNACGDASADSIVGCVTVIPGDDDTAIGARFTANQSIAAAEARCGFITNGFNFTNQVVVDPHPPLSAITGNALIPPYADPPLGGYKDQPETANRFPFYYNTGDLLRNYELNGLFFPVETSSTLTFRDAPTDPLLVFPQFLGFVTNLVGVHQDGTSENLYSFTWQDSFNGTIGGIAFQARSNFLLPVDRGSGTSGIRVTSINGIVQTPPNVTCAANPSVLWPPNRKPVLVTISGTATAGTQVLVADGGAFAVADSEAQVEPNGTISIGAGGDYSFAIALAASRDGYDKNGRHYTVAVTVSDVIGNKGSCFAAVIVPHDQGH